MGYIIIALFLVILAFLVIRRARVKSNSLSTASTLPSAQSTTEPPDYLERASGWLNTPTSITEMLEQDRKYVMGKLVEILELGGIYERKYAAFALGQIGDSSTLHNLETALAKESVSGVRDAVGASVVAVKMASIEKGYSELDRRRIIKDVYDGRPPHLP